MSKFYGANPAELRALATAMDAEAERLSGWPRQVGRKLDSDIWTGPDADRFRHRWNGQHSSSLREAVKYLKDSAVRLRANADDQEATSADLVGGGMPAGPTGPLPLPPAPEPWRPTTAPNVPTMTAPTEHDQWGEVGEAWQNVGESLPPIWNAWFEPIFTGDTPRLTEAGAAGIRFGGTVIGAWVTDCTFGAYNPHIFEEGTPFADNPVPMAAAAAPPKDLSDVLNTVVQGYDVGEGEIVVTTVDSPDGPRVFVSVPGTETWIPSSSSNAMDGAGNFVTASGGRSTMTNAVEQAIANLNLPPNAQVTLVGHSQGGMSVADLVSNSDFVSKYHVTNAITFGSRLTASTSTAGSMCWSFSTSSTWFRGSISVTSAWRQWCRWGPWCCRAWWRGTLRLTMRRTTTR